MGDELPPLSNDGRIAIEKRGHIFLIVIDRPKKLNGFSVKMLSELGRAFSMMEDDTDIRCGVLCAEGRNFTAGLELNQVAKHLAEGPLFPEDNVDPVNLHGKLRTKPLVSAVQGICFTLGIELMLASDIVVAASDCRFAQIEVKRGILGTPAGAAPRSGSEHSQCAGALDAYSVVIDWKFAPKWDVYAGVMFSQENGGLANGFLQRNNVDPTVGLRFRF